MENSKVKVTKLRPSQKSRLIDSIKACISNGERLLDDAMTLELQEPPSTKLMLSMIAQEEFAKAFLLFMVYEDVIAWNAHILRVMNDHSCKQLVGVIIEYVGHNWDFETIDELSVLIREEVELEERLPRTVADAINILKHEKIRRWESSNWEWLEPPEYESSVLKIAKGKRDRIKQDSLYVRLGSDGRIINEPINVQSKDSEDEFNRAELYRRFVSSFFSSNNSFSYEYKKVYEVLKVMFKRSG